MVTLSYSLTSATIDGCESRETKKMSGIENPIRFERNMHFRRLELNLKRAIK